MIALIVLIAAIAVVSFIAWNGRKNVIHEAPQRTVQVTIDEGMSASQIANMLEAKKVIKSAFVFRLVVRRDGVGSDFKPGEYTFKTGMDNEEVIKVLIEGPPIKYVSITIPEGWTQRQIAARVSRLTKIDEQEYMDMVNDGVVLIEYPFLKGNGAPTRSLEGYLYPETFRVQEDVTIEELINLQLAQFQEKTAGLAWSNAQSLGRKTYEILIIASMIERETLVDEERPIVASVIYNRLAKDMLLQIDATIQYALPETKERLTLDDLKIDSPYNTYKYKGLPPGPICNPSASSIDAALNPSGDDYLYYVLSPDNSGRHVFAKTYDEFLNAKNQYRAGQE